MKILIVHYSRTGTTKRVAEEIGNQTMAKVVEIKSSEMKMGFLGYLKAGKQVLEKTLPVIEVPEIDFEEFDLVVIGTPIWVGTMASPVRTFLNQNKEKFWKTAFFCTCGDKQTKAFNEMKELTESEPVAVLELNKKDFKKSCQSKIEKFVEELK